MKRIILFLATNLAVMLVLGVTASLLGVNRFLTANGLNLGMLLAFSALIGFGGAFISLFMSKMMAKWSTGARVITSPGNSTEFWLVQTVERLSQRAGIAMPEVAIYDGEPNAFATGASKNASLVAVSTGLLQSMSKEEVEAVLAHEVAHVANGDMVTLTLIQGVVNTFVVFISRVIGYLVDSFLRRNDESSSGTPPVRSITVVGSVPQCPPSRISSRRPSRRSWISQPSVSGASSPGKDSVAVNRGSPSSASKASATLCSGTRRPIVLRFGWSTRRGNSFVPSRMKV